MANAGVMTLPPGLTKDGYELHFGVNHVAHALLIRKLLLLLRNTAKIDPGPSNTGLVTSLGLMDKAIVHLGNINKFLDEGQGHLNQVWAVGVPKHMIKQGEFYEPIGVLTKSYTPFCLYDKLAQKLWDWTEDELKAWLL